jgi:hypothetical protein
VLPDGGGRGVRQGRQLEPGAPVRASRGSVDGGATRVSWTLCGQVVLLIAVVAIAIDGTISSIIDKCREDDIKRKEAGLR